MSALSNIVSSQSASNFTWTVVDGFSAGLMGMGINYIQGKLANDGRDNGLKFYYQEEMGGKIVNVLTRKLASDVMLAAQDLIVNEYRKLFEKKLVQDKRRSNAERQRIITENIVDDKNSFGYIELDNPEHQRVVAYDDWGDVCVDAMMLAIPTKEDIVYTTNMWDEKEEAGWANYGDTIRGKKLVWYDTAALVNSNSERNILLNKVQGRDYTRKELIGNGDIHFSVQGHICSNMPDVYPKDEVRKFIQIMNYKGVVECNNPIVNLYGINKIVILNFNLPTREGFKSQQDYSFEAVGIQPDKEISVLQDTITIINQEMVKADNDDIWTKLIKGKLEALKNQSVDALSQGLALGAGYLDSML